MSVPADRTVLALAFDWIGDILYMLRVDTNTLPGTLELVRASIYDSKNIINVFPDLQDTVDSGSTFQMVMNPFTGLVFSINDLIVGDVLSCIVALCIGLKPLPLVPHLCKAWIFVLCLPPPASLYSALHKTE